jgi:hypothetical protein
MNIMAKTIDKKIKKIKINKEGDKRVVEKVKENVNNVVEEKGGEEKHSGVSEIKKLKQTYQQQVEENMKNAWNDYIEIANLENDIWEGENFLKELESSGHLDENNEIVKNIREIIQDRKNKIEELERKNAFIKEIYRDFQQEKEKVQKKLEEIKAQRIAEKLKIEEKINSVEEVIEKLLGSQKLLLFTDLLNVLKNQARDYLDVIRDEEEISKRDPEEVLKIKSVFYVPKKGTPGAKKIFGLIKKLERKVYNDDKEREKLIKDFKEESNIDLAQIFNPNITMEGKKAAVELKFPLNINNKRTVFLRGAILFSVEKSEKGPVWKIEKMVGNVGEALNLNYDLRIRPGFSDAPRLLLQAIKEAIKIKKESQ